MVLEGYPSSSADFSHDAPADTDGFGGDTLSGNQAPKLDLSTLPGRFPLGGLFGWTENSRLKFIFHSQMAASGLVKRNLTQVEAETLGRISAKEYRTISYGTPLGCAAGLWRAYNTRSSFNFPIHQLPESFNPDVLRIPGFGEVLKGEFARTFWRVSRFTAFGLFGGLVTTIVTMSYATTVASVEMSAHPLLKGFNQELAKAAKEQRAQDMQKATKPQRPAPQTDSSGQGQAKVSDLWKGHRQAIGGESAQYDDGSPMDGQSMAAFQDKAYDQTTFSNEISRTEASNYPMPRAQATNPRRAPPFSSQQASTRTQTHSTQSSQPFDGYNDASPTASYPPSSSSEAPSGSAWDRVRRGTTNTSSSSSGSKRHREQQPPPTSYDNAGNTSEDSFSFSSADEDRQLAHNEAQKDFDERIERERWGGDFGSSAGGGTGRPRW
ncbi:MAG: hypothetical protein LQ340_005307 [Diploschistes diacapsis]|nr:MAG: hypothetical protein LQ340_005307 [Diploschistes diacapsis]